MDQREDIVVIGGGVIGVCAAYFLQKEGRRVTLLERGDVCSGCSYGNAGWVVPSHSVPLAAPGVIVRALKWMLDPESPFYVKPRPDLELLSWMWRFRAAAREAPMRKAVAVAGELSRASMELYAELIADEGLECRFERNGLLVLYETSRGYEEGVEEARLLGEYGVPGRLLSARQVQDLEPTVRSDMAGGVHYPGDAHLMPSEFVQGLAAVCRKLGVDVRTGVEVLGFDVSGSRVAAVRTAQGDLRPDQVVLAAGSWSPALARGLPVSLPVQPAKGYSITFERPARTPSLPLLLGEAKLGVTPMKPMLRLAGTLELSGLNLDVAPRRVRAIRRAADAYLDLGLEPGSGTVWCGMRPLTPDGLPIIGRPPSLSNLTVATGHSMTGITLGPITGKLVCQLITGVTPVVDPTPLSPARFG